MIINYILKILSHCKNISKSTNILKLVYYSQSFIDLKEKCLKQDRHTLKKTKLSSMVRQIEKYE